MSVSPSVSKPVPKMVYKKWTQHKHALERAEMYVGSKEPETNTVFVPEADSEGRTRMVSRAVTYVPAFYKIFDEILVNAADNKVRDPSMDTIKVVIDKENGEISVMNNGRGVPVEIHEEEKIYIPELIFGHLLTSSNYDDDEKRVTGGRNGYGAKLTNIYSLEFAVETHDSAMGKTYKQKWSTNMTVCSPPKITSSAKKSDYTKITFKPDLARLNMESISDDTVALLQKRVYDLTGSLRGIKVFLNGERIKISNFKDYVSMFLGSDNRKDDIEMEKSLSNEKPKIVYEKPNERWEIAVAVSETGTFQHVSFVNSIATTKGGTHVTHVVDQLVKYLVEQIQKKDKTAVVKPAQVKNQIFLFVNCLIENPSFDSQTKETMTLRPAHFGSTCPIPEAFHKRVAKLGILDAILESLKAKGLQELKKTDGQKRSRLSGIDDLSDANNAGTKKSKDCTLFLTEGLSAKSFALTGIQAMTDGRDHYGAFPLRGKLLNVRDATSKKILDNTEITHLKQILGLKEGKEYLSITDLRYGHVCILVDSDADGKHIKGLILNWLESSYPSLLRIPEFLLDFKSPIVKCSKNGKDVLHYTLQEYEGWKKKNASGSWTIKYFKGLGTSKDTDVKKYFLSIKKHLKRFHELQPEDSEKLDMVFSKKRANDRKEWLRKYNKDDVLDMESDNVSIGEFIDKDLIEFSWYDCVRSIPSVVDGLKPGQRKILYTAFKTKLVYDKNDIKVAQFAGEVSKLTEYRHGEQSLCETIVGMAQDFVGSNNIALLQPEGQFGTRLYGGSDAASARYIYTKLRKYTRALFPVDDDSVLDYQLEDGKEIEPKYFVPVLPMVLVNGAEGIGSAYSTSIPCFNPKEIMEWLISRTKIEDDNKDSLSQLLAHKFVPWYEGFTGSVKEVVGIDGNEESGKFMFSGIVKKIDSTVLEISELPIQSWTEKYKKFLDALVANGTLKDFKEQHKINKVKFILKVIPEGMAKLEGGEGLMKNLKLTSVCHTTNMMLFSSDGYLKKYDSVNDILVEFYDTRIEYYKKRKEFLLSDLKKTWRWLENKFRFVQYVVSNKISINNRKRSELEETLDKEKFERKESEFSYLLNMPVHSLTEEKILALQQECTQLKLRYETISSTTVEELYRMDLISLTKALM